MEAGRLIKFADNWATITSDSWILNTIKGCRIDFDSDIDFHSSNVRTSFSPSEDLVIQKEIKKLLGMGAVEQIPESQRYYVSPIFVTPKKDGSVRMILNLKRLNQSVEYVHYKMDTLETALKLITPNCFMASVDLRSAYHTLLLRIGSICSLHIMANFIIILVFHLAYLVSHIFSLKC